MVFGSLIKFYPRKHDNFSNQYNYNLEKRSFIRRPPDFREVKALTNPFNEYLRPNRKLESLWGVGARGGAARHRRHPAPRCAKR
jgi:hypothetical protein